MKEFECLNIDLDAKLVLFNKLVDELKCENESLKMHAKCLIAEPIAKKDENICCNHVVVLDFVPSVSSTSKNKSMYSPPHKRNQKVERKALKSKIPFRSQPKVLDRSKFVLTCHHCGVIGHIRPQYPKLKREQRRRKSLVSRIASHARTTKKKKKKTLQRSPMWYRPKTLRKLS